MSGLVISPRSSTLSLRNCAGDPGKSRLVKMRQSSLDLCVELSAVAGHRPLGGRPLGRAARTSGAKPSAGVLAEGGASRIAPHLAYTLAKCSKWAPQLSPRAALPTLCTTSRAFFCYDSVRYTQFLMCIASIFPMHVRPMNCKTASAFR